MNSRSKFYIASIEIHDERENSFKKKCEDYNNNSSLFRSINNPLFYSNNYRFSGILLLNSKNYLNLISSDEYTKSHHTLIHQQISSLVVLKISFLDDYQ